MIMSPAVRGLWSDAGGQEVERSSLTMPSKSAIIKAMGKHEKTLETMRQRPRPSNLRWSDIESLFVHLGAEIRKGKGSAIIVILNGQRAYFHRPHPGDKADKGAIESALRFLKDAGAIE